MNHNLARVGSKFTSVSKLTTTHCIKRRISHNNYDLSPTLSRGRELVLGTQDREYRGTRLQAVVTTKIRLRNTRLCQRRRRIAGEHRF